MREREGGKGGFEGSVIVVKSANEIAQNLSSNLPSEVPREVQCGLRVHVSPTKCPADTCLVRK
jgi:hypothetical protein